MSNRDELVYRLARLGVRLNEVRTVLRALPAIQRAHEAECSLPDSGRWTAAGDRAWNRLVTALAGVLVEGRPCRVVRQTDPRGACVSVYAPGTNVESGEPMLRLGAEGFTSAAMDRLAR